MLDQRVPTIVLNGMASHPVSLNERLAIGSDKDVDDGDGDSELVRRSQCLNDLASA